MYLSHHASGGKIKSIRIKLLLETEAQKAGNKGGGRIFAGIFLQSHFPASFSSRRERARLPASRERISASVQKIRAGIFDYPRREIYTYREKIASFIFDRSVTGSRFCFAANFSKLIKFHIPAETTEKSLARVKLARRISEFMPRFRCFVFSKKKIPFSRRAWLFPLSNTVPRALCEIFKLTKGE